MARGGFGGGGGGGGAVDLTPLLPRDGTRPMVADLDLFRDPSQIQHAATKRYVDTLYQQDPHMVGVFSAPQDLCQFFPGTGYPSGPTPPATTLRIGEYLICSVPGTVPPGSVISGSVWAIGDWLYCQGPSWGQLGVGANVIARQVAVSPPVHGQSNVQDALEQSVARTGDTLSGHLTSEAGTPTLPNHLARKADLDALASAANDALNLKVNRTGDNLTGHLLSSAGDPVSDNHLARKAYVDNFTRITQWTAGRNYVVGQIVYWDNLPFQVLTPITNAPATPDFSTICLAAGSQADYWAGVPQGWVTGNWILLATMPAYGTYRFQFDARVTGADASFLIDIATSYNGANMTITSLARNTAGQSFDQFRLSATGAGGSNPVRLEAHISNAAGGPEFKLTITGFARQSNSNQTTIPKPPTGQAANQGGTQYALVDIRRVTSGTGATAGNLGLITNFIRADRIRFPHANSNNEDDGRISARLHARGLNIVGIPTEDGDTRRYINIWGDVELQPTHNFITLADGTGFFTQGGGRFYKATGTGLIIRKSNGGQQPQIEENDGTNRRPIIDQQSGDARYVLRTELGLAEPRGGGSEPTNPFTKFFRSIVSYFSNGH